MFRKSLFLLMTASLCYGQSHTTTIAVKADGRFGKSNAITWNTARNFATANVNGATDTSGFGVGIQLGVNATVGAADTFKFYRSYFATDSVNSVAVATALTSRAGFRTVIDDVRFHVKVFGGVDSNYCPSMIYAVLCSTNATTVAIGTLDDWAKNPSGFKTGIDSLAYDSLDLPVGADTTELVFSAGALLPRFRSRFAAAKTAAWPLVTALLVANDFTNDSLLWSASGTYMGVNVLYTETSVSSRDPYYEVLWHEEAASATSERGSGRGPIRKVNRGTWR